MSSADYPTPADCAGKFRQCSILDLAQGEVVTLGEYIAALERLRAEHGSDLRVQKWVAGARVNAPMPRIAHMIVRRAGPHELPQFWHETDKEVPGPPCIRI